MRIVGIYECNEIAKERGFDKMEFTGLLPAGGRKCKWIDAYFGFLSVEGVNDDNTFSTVKDLASAFGDFPCIIADDEDAEQA